MKQNSSSRKANEQAREMIASILLFDISDPRLRLVTITACEVSFDRSVCNVFYTTEPSRYDEVAAAFQKAKGRIRTLMAQRLPWRVSPELRFHLDNSVDAAERIASALARDADRNEESAHRAFDAEMAEAGEPAEVAEAVEAGVCAETGTGEETQAR